MRASGPLFPALFLILDGIVLFIYSPSGTLASFQEEFSSIACIDADMNKLEGDRFGRSTSKISRLNMTESEASPGS